MVMTKYEFVQEVSNKSDLFFLVYTKITLQNLKALITSY